MEPVASELKAARLRAGLTHEEVAKLVGVTRQAYANWENGVRIPDVDRAIRLAAVLGVPVEELFASAARLRLQRRAAKGNQVRADGREDKHSGLLADSQSPAAEGGEPEGAAQKRN